MLLYTSQSEVGNSRFSSVSFPLTFRGHCLRWELLSSSYLACDKVGICLSASSLWGLFNLLRKKDKGQFPIHSVPHDTWTPAKSTARLVHTLEWWHRLALVRVQGVLLDSTVGDFHRAVRLLLEGQSVLHPVLIITLRVVLAGMGTARLLAVSSGVGGLGPTTCQSTIFHRV